jgi:hypothetical protein
VVSSSADKEVWKCNLCSSFEGDWVDVYFHVARDHKAMEKKKEHIQSVLGPASPSSSSLSSSASNPNEDEEDNHEPPISSLS